ncbi:multidrug resistance-associated protein 1 isoform X1 [Astyanax mexicanus]|uniref:multidrug resistance-associated protein 1 isoform X1 n=2 Tax=Astyanax mexicanus TaxID=7994 RepID=UPI0020CAA7A8|nr:multidrug resistance-associated protein 1 isoform X1 [Astyanax mexicanus]
MRCSLTGSFRRFLCDVRWAAMRCRKLLLCLIDLWNDEHSDLSLDFEQAWRMQLRNNEEIKDPEGEALLSFFSFTPGLSLLYTLCTMLRSSLLKVTVLRLSADLLILFGLFTLRWAILFCEGQPVLDWAEYVYTLVILGSACCYAVSQHLLQRLSRKTAASAQAALSGALCRKALSLSNSPQHQTDCTEVVSQLSVDADRVTELVGTLPWLFSSPLRVALCVWILWIELGFAVMGGVILLLCLVLVQSSMEHRIRLLQCSQVVIREESKNLIKEMLNEIKALKLQAWENIFQHQVSEVWERELETLRVLGYLKAFSTLIHICMPFLVCLFSLGAFVLMDEGNVLTPSQVFMCLCIFRMLLHPILKVHTLSSHLKETEQSACRLEEFLMTGDPDTKNFHVDTLQELPSRLQHCDRCNNRTHCETEKESELFPIRKQGSGGALWQYLRAFGWHWVILTLLAQLGVCLVGVAHNGLLCVWTAEAKEVQGLEEWKELRNSRLSVYTLFGLLQALLVSWAAYCVNCGSFRASQSLQCNLISSVLHLPLSVHLTTDPTHLLHTFTQNMYVVEEQLPQHLHTLGSCLLQMIASLLLITFIIPVFSIALCPLTFLFLTVQSHYSSVQNQVRHMSSVVPSVHMKQFNGDPTLPHMREELCLNHVLQTLSQNLQIQQNSIDMERWALLRLDAVWAVGLFLISLVLLDSADSLDSGIIALALVYGFSMREVMHLYTVSSAEISSKALAVQRICVYTKMEKEPECRKDHRDPPDWPWKGEIEFIQYATEACPTSPAFRGVNFSISKGESVGVISREKAETDGVISCLFRAVEASCGAILIDGVNIASVSLHTLRSRLHLIPQVPVLFSSSVRANVDPYALCSDAQVWQVLELCQLKEKLLHPIQSSSTAHRFISSGEKRLLCLARALLGKAGVLLVEEAHPDSESECLLQQLVRTHLPECTVLWLSQNPNNVMHTDRVLVLDAGHPVEFDSPSVLLQQGKLFRQLLRESQRGGV